MQYQRLHSEDTMPNMMKKTEHPCADVLGEREAVAGRGGGHEETCLDLHWALAVAGSWGAMKELCLDLHWAL